ncbi:hypothetical protein [Paenarthrobacter nicotinovorans]|uniref:hypothetical protein n=1 Tax=Paenarthrobacter nicotinovorans TaxID=29320 RepID=UPI0027D836CD|nr:hypothetical protein [Paenarthrobacter nicotinovorans]
MAALALTVNTAVLITMLSLDTFAYQCLGQQQCRGPLWGLLNAPPYEFPGVRLALGVALPVVIVGLIYIFSHVSRNRYERVEPPAPDTTRPVDAADGLSAAAQKGGLRSPGFWSGRRWHRHLSRLHLTAGIAVVSGMLSWSVSQLGEVMNLQSDWTVTAARIVCWVSIGVVLVTVGMLGWDKAHELHTRLALIASLVVLAAAIAVALMLPVELTGVDKGSPAVTQPAGVLPGIEVSLYWGLILIGLLVFPLMCQQVVAWAVRLRKSQKTGDGAAAGDKFKVFPFAAPVVMNLVALVLVNSALLSLIVLVAEVLGEVGYGSGPGAEVVSGSTLWILKPVIAVTAALALDLAILVVAFGVTVGIWLWIRPKGMARHLVTPLTNQYNAPGGNGMYIPVSLRGTGSSRKKAWKQSAFDATPYEDSVPPVETAVDAPAPGVTPAGNDGTPAANKWVRKIARMILLARNTRNLAAILLILTAVVGLGGAVVAITVGLYPVPWLVQVVTWVSVGSPVVYAAIVRIVFTQEHLRKAFMTPFDVGTFFPRSFHPFAPPCYTERAVPELTRRIWYLHDHNGRVVLTAHSQGSIIAAAVLARKADPKETSYVGLLSLGSPLTKLYRWAFPALFSDELLKSLAEGAGGFSPVHWVNVHYKTDYIGGPVKTDGWSRDGKFDVCLVDPATHWYVFGQPLPHILSHTGYWADDNFWREVNIMCNEVNEKCQRLELPPEEPSGNGEVPVAPDPTLPVPYQ